MGAGDYADFLAPLLDEFEEPPVLVGHSFGGRVAVCLAATHRERVNSLVLTGVPLLRRSPVAQPPIGFRVVRSLHRLGLFSDERMERLRRSRGSADYRAATGIMRDILVKVVNEEYPTEMREVAAHVDLIWGSDDADVPVSVAERSVSLFSDAELQVIGGAGHMLHLQRPEVLSAVVSEALS